jgi:hypothetical protein
MLLKPLAGHAICNIGDALVLFSGGILRSNLHRVVQVFLSVLSSWALTIRLALLLVLNLNLNAGRWYISHVPGTMCNSVRWLRTAK